MVTGYLSSAIGLYEQASGDRRYLRPKPHESVSNLDDPPVVGERSGVGPRSSAVGMENNLWMGLGQYPP